MQCVTPESYNMANRAQQLPLLPRQLLGSSSTSETMSPMTAPTPVPIPVVPFDKQLPSSAIRREGLLSVEVVLAQNTKLKGPGKAGTLALKLAKQCLFGEDVLRRCTPLGTPTLPALPRAEMMQLKAIMLQQFPQYWNCVEEFEPIWKQCLEAVQQCCKRLRNAK